MKRYPRLRIHSFYNLEMNIGRDKNALFDRAGPAKPVGAIHAIWPSKFAKTCYKPPIQK
jgi:hypothetical protein